MSLTSIRSRVTLWSAIVVAAALSVFGAGAAWNLRNELVEAIDLQITSEAQDFFEAIDRHSVDWSNARAVEALFDQSKRLRYVEIRDPSRRLLYRSSNLHDQEILPLPPRDRYYTAKWKGSTIRYGVFRHGSGLILALGKNLDETGETVGDLGMAYLLTLPIVIVVVGFGGWWIAHRALAPVKLIADQAERISASDLHQRLPQLRQEDEIGHLTRVLNRMFHRLEKSFGQVTRFTSDASHELKTPLARMRAGVEAALASDGMPASQRKVFSDVIEQTTQLSHIVDSLLFLSRADDRQLKLQHARVDLSALVADLIEDAEILAAPSAITIQCEMPPSLHVAADVRLVSRTLMNLLDNAIKYNRPGGQVNVSASIKGSNGVVTLRNTGPGVSPNAREQIFERFFRGDPAHAGEVPGHGLGLSIAREIARAHGGELTLVGSNAERTEFTLVLPLAESGANGQETYSTEREPAHARDEKR